MIRHGLLDGLFSSSSALERLPLGADFENSLLGRPYPGSMPKAYPFWTSDNPL